MACIINKWRAKISQMRLYNVKDPPGTGGYLKKKKKKNLKSTVTQKTKVVIKFKKNIL